MAEFFYMGAAVVAAGRRRAKEMTKLLDTQIDQDLIFVQTGEINIPAVYNMTCSTLGRIIETAIAMKAVPSPSHLPRLRLIVEEVYIHRAELTDSSLKMLLKHIKSAFQAGWFSNEDKDRLLMMVDKTSLGYYNLDNWNVEPANAHSVSEIISRFYPRMRVEHILVSFNVKAGDKGSEAYFDISPNTVPHQNLWLLVARSDDMDTAACLTSPSNVDFLINNSEVPNRSRKKMGKGPQLPTNVTKMVKDGVNHLQAIGEFDGDYVITLAFMSFISSPDPSCLQDYVYPISNDVESDCVVANGQSRIFLDCPIGGRRIRTPVKGHLCKHSQCFDYDYFMEANFMRPLWKCPLAHCNQRICNLDIRIDQTFLKILNEVADDVGDVYVSDDSSWTVSLAEKSQINRDTINQQNHVTDDPENLVSLGANENLVSHSSCDMVHTPPLVQQTRPNPNPTASQLPAQTQPQNSQAQTDQPIEADNSTCTRNRARRTSNPARRTTVFTPVHLTPPSAAPFLRKLERRPRGTTGEAQGTTSVTPVIKKRGRKPKITTDPAVGLNIRRVPPTQVPEVSRDEMSSVGMRGGLTGEKREAALLERLAPPRQPIDADKPLPGPTTTVPVELMKQLNTSHPSALPR